MCAVSDKSYDLDGGSSTSIVCDTCKSGYHLRNHDNDIDDDNAANDADPDKGYEICVQGGCTNNKYSLEFSPVNGT
jgi:hypothetical protein